MNDRSLLTPASSKTRISQEERRRREAAINDARHSVRLKGFVISDHAEEPNRRYIEGELTSEELTAAILANPDL